MSTRIEALTLGVLGVTLLLSMSGLFGALWLYERGLLKDGTRLVSFAIKTMLASAGGICIMTAVELFNIATKFAFTP